MENKKIKITKKSLVIEFLKAQTETNKDKVFELYQLTDLPKINEIYFTTIWISLYGAIPKESKSKTDHEEIITTVRKMFKEQEQLFEPVRKNQIAAILTNDSEEKKLFLIEADKFMDAYQRKNYEIRRYMEANPF